MDHVELIQIGDGSRSALPVDAHVRLKIGDLAKATGRTVRALRLYEELGLLTPGERTQGGFRVYGPVAIERVNWIGKLQDLGFTLSAIVELVGAGTSDTTGQEAMGRVKLLFKEKLSDVRGQMEKLRALEQELLSSLSYLEECVGCSRGPVNHACASCAEPGHDAANTPPLVNGIVNRL